MDLLFLLLALRKIPVIGGGGGALGGGGDVVGAYDFLVPLAELADLFIDTFFRGSASS
jgi:hypothetical protein